MKTKNQNDLMAEIVKASQEMLPTHLAKPYCHCGTCRFIRLREETIEVLTGRKQEGDAFSKLGASVEELEARAVIGPNQVIGRIHHNADHPEPVRAVLNSIGMGLPDNMALYAAPQEGRVAVLHVSGVSKMVEALKEARDVLVAVIKASAPDYFQTDEDAAKHLTIQRIDQALGGSEP